MTLPVTDARSNKNDQIKHAVEVIGRSVDRLKVFKAIYRGKKAIKTVSGIAATTKLDKIRVLQEAAKLSGNGIVQAEKVGRELGYRKDLFYSTNRSRILQLVANPEKLKRLPTKTNSANSSVVIKGVNRKPKIKELSIDDIESFKRVKSAAVPATGPAISEKKFKLGIQRIVGERGKFSDWGGEKGDY
jgi:hypothetical protein